MIERCRPFHGLNFLLRDPGACAPGFMLSPAIAGFVSIGRVAGLWMLVVAAVLGCRFVGEDFIEGHVVAIDAVACWTTDDQVIGIAKIADQGSHGDVDNIVSKATTVGPSAGNESAILKRILNVALQYVAAEYAQSRITRIVRITWTTTGQTHLSCREIDLDQIRNVNAGNVTAVCLRRHWRLKHEKIDQAGEFRRFSILSKEFSIRARARAAVQILIGDRDESFVEQRIALACNLYKRSIVFRLVLVIQHSHRPSTSGCINTRELLVAAEFCNWHFERHEMK